MGSPGPIIDNTLADVISPALLKAASPIQPPILLIQECYMSRTHQFSSPKHILIPMIKPLRILAACVALAFITTPAVPAQADTAQPILRVGKHCPSGYRASGEYCVPRSGSTDTPQAIEKKGNCPSGYRKSGRYCIPRSGTQVVPHILEKKGSCPPGYRKSGHYCVERG